MPVTLINALSTFRLDLYRRCKLEARPTSFTHLLRLFFKRGVLSVFIYRLNHYFYFKRPYSYIVYRLLRLVEYHYCHNEIHCEAVIGPGLVVNDFGYVAIAEKVIIGDNCTMTGKATLTLGGMEGITPKDRIRLGNNCVIGHNVRVISPINIADGVQIKSNSVVMVAENSEGAIISGFPAKKIKTIPMSSVVRWNPILYRLM